MAHWSEADKGILLAAITLPFVLVWTVRVGRALGDARVAPYLARDFLPWMWRYQLLQLGALGLMVASGCVLRRRPGPHPLYLTACLQYWFFAQAVSLWTVGPFTSPFGLLTLPSIFLAMMVHAVRPVVWGTATFTAVLAATTVLERLGHLPYAPLLGSEGPATGWMLSTGVSSYVASGVVIFLFAQVLEDWRARERELYEQSRTDELTRVSNRRQFMDVAQRRLAEARAAGRPLSVVLVDVDHFKRVNDTHGHPAGDRVLQAVAEALRAEVRGSDAVARLGGEEFALLLPDAGPDAALQVAERCRTRVAQARTPGAGGGQGGGQGGGGEGGAPVAVTVSLGVASACHPDAGRLEDLLRLADAALYRAKQEGRDRVARAA
jgi:diguanylate cyclase (GGDEF)-like protein